MKTGSVPFSVSKQENFFDRLGEYVGDVFYDILPEKGYELRDEQNQSSFFFPSLRYIFIKPLTNFATIKSLPMASPKYSTSPSGCSLVR